METVMQPEHHLPGDIERTSMNIIAQELDERGVSLQPGTEAVVKRVIHATADFDYAETLYFSEQAVPAGTAALRAGADIVTDTNMGKAGISKPALAALGGQVHCFMADPDVAAAAARRGTTRAFAAMKKAAERYPHAVYAVGNAPTALLTLCQLMEEGLRPSLIIAVPVGFVNVVESKEKLIQTGARYAVPVIAARGRKGGSNVAAAVCNALLYSAADLLDPANRGWQG